MRIWPWYTVPEEGGDSIYELIDIAGLTAMSIDIPRSDKVILVCKSVDGFLNLAFPMSAIDGKKVLQATRKQFIAAGGDIAKYDNEPEERL